MTVPEWGRRVPEKLFVFGAAKLRRHRLARGRKLEPVIRLGDSVRIIGSAAILRFRQVAGDQLGLPVLEERRGGSEKLAGNILSGRRHVGESRIVLVQELVVETIVQNLPDPLLDLADVHQHPGR